MSRLTVSVTDFGAKPNDDALQTDKFQKAIDYCFEKGGGEVTVPEGEYLIGDIRLRSNITFHLLKNAVIKGSRNFEDFYNIENDKYDPIKIDNTLVWKSPSNRTPEYANLWLYSGVSKWNVGLIRIMNSENVEIIGEEGSVIDGQNCYCPGGEENYRGAHGISVQFCKNLRFSGYTIRHTGNWAHCISDSKNIITENLTVLGGHDGVHYRGCDNVEVKNCKIKTGDDAVAGFDNINVHITDCELGSACSVFRFGGRNVLIENCTACGPCEYPFRGSMTDEEKSAGAYTSKTARYNTNAFFIYFVDETRKLREKQGNIIVRNCKVKNIDRLLRINLSGIETWQKGTPPDDITFENITADGMAKWINAYGNDECAFTLRLKNIDYTMRDGFEENSFMMLGKYKDISLENVKVHNFKGDTLIKTWGDLDKIHLDNFVCDGLDESKYIKKADDEFDVRYI